MLGVIELNELKIEVRKPKIKDIKGLDLSTQEGVMQLSKRCIIGLAPTEIEELELAVLAKATKLVDEYIEKNL